MRRYLVVANQTLGGEHLLDKVRECVAAGPCHFHVLVPASPGDEDPYFELHAIGGSNEFISFMPRQVAASDVVINPAPYQNVVSKGTTSQEGREIPYTECVYEHDGQQWRQIFFAVPVDNDESVVVRAQASEPHVDVLFQAAQAAAATLIPLR